MLHWRFIVNAFHGLLKVIQVFDKVFFCFKSSPLDCNFDVPRIWKRALSLQHRSAMSKICCYLHVSPLALKKERTQTISTVIKGALAKSLIKSTWMHWLLSRLGTSRKGHLKRLNQGKVTETLETSAVAKISRKSHAMSESGAPTLCKLHVEWCWNLHGVRGVGSGG